MSKHWPKRLRFQRGAKQLVIEYEGTDTVTIPYVRLREESPSAESRGHGAGPKPDRPPVPADIDVLRAEPVGRYAVRIAFSDGHDTGLYSWDYLAELAAVRT